MSAVLSDEQVVLLGDDGMPVGTASKAGVHGADTPLHLAFSCYVADETGRLLVTRRALTKRTWPGVWTNSFCGHPAPDEALEDAVHRRAEQELGTRIDDLRCALPEFRYRAVDASGIVENEICPVFVATVHGPLDPDPEEVAESAWVNVESLRIAVLCAPFAFSPWMREQLPRLDEAALIGEALR